VPVSGRWLVAHDEAELRSVTGLFIFQLLKKASLVLLGDFVVVEGLITVDQDEAVFHGQ